MAITATHLQTMGGLATFDGGENFSSLTNFTPSANKLVLAWVTISYGGAGGSPYPDPAMVGYAAPGDANGLTWVKIASIPLKIGPYGADWGRFVLFRAMGAAPTAGYPYVQDQYGGGGGAAASWTIVEFGGVDKSGTNGSGAIVQSATYTAPFFPEQSNVITLSAFASATNAAAGGAAVSGNPGFDIIPGSGFTQLGEDQTSPCGAFSEWKSSEDTTVDYSSASFQLTGGIAVEIKEEVFPRPKIIVPRVAVQRASSW